MSLSKLIPIFHKIVDEKKRQGLAKSNEFIITGIQKGQNGFGPRLFIEGYPGRKFLRMNSNSYLNLDHHPDVIDAEFKAVEKYGCGPGAVRFISGTFQPHKDLETKLAEFHQREAGMLFSSAYAAMIGVLPALSDENTLIISDELNHNCIINAIRLAKSTEKRIFKHADTTELEQIIKQAKGQVQRVCVISDGIFSMRGDHAPLQRINEICLKHECDFAQGIITVIDDSHGVGAVGLNGRGTEEITDSRADILIATLGKAFGVNGGYVASDKYVIDYLRESAASYIYSNSITPAEAAAALSAVEIVDSRIGKNLLHEIQGLAADLRKGLIEIGFETITGQHPIVPVLIRDTEKTEKLVRHLFNHDILATGLNFPVVAKGEQEIRLQVSAGHTKQDIAYVLEILADFN